MPGGVWDFKLYPGTGGRRVIGISGSLIWSKSLLELIFNPCDKFRWSPEGPVSQVHSPHLHAGAPGIFSHLLRSVQMLKTEWCAECYWKLPHLFIPSKTATLVPEFAVEDLPLGRTVAFVPEFEVEDLPLGRRLWWSWNWVFILYLHSVRCCFWEWPGVLVTVKQGVYWFAMK